MSIHLYPIRRAFASLLGCLLFVLPAMLVSAQGPPPVGQWDCVLSGKEQGVAHLFFYPTGTLAGRGIITGRVLYTYTGRTTGIFTNGGVLYTNILGGAKIEGNWSYASPTTTNRIVGFINLLSTQAGSTQLVTNALSFNGSARASKLTLLARGYPGQVMFLGIPLQQTNDFIGSYYAIGRKQGAPAPFVEAFDLSPVSDPEYRTNTIVTALDCSTTNLTTITNYSFFMITSVVTNECVAINDPLTTNYCAITNTTLVTNSTFATTVTITRQTCLSTNTGLVEFRNPFPTNYYNVRGSGPAYQYEGLFLVSRQKYAAFYQVQGANNQLVTVYAGPFNPATGRGSLIGTDGVNRNIKYSIYHGPAQGVP
jgi:hypothetical protein